LNQSFADELFHRLSHNGHEPEVETIYLDLTGPTGSPVERSLIVENTRAEPSEVICKISEFRSSDGMTFRSPIEVDPVAFRLLAGETRSISIRLRLDPDIFMPDRTYTGSLLINQAEQSIVVVLTARATGNAQERPVVNLIGPIGSIASTSLTLTNSAK